MAIEWFTVSIYNAEQVTYIQKWRKRLAGTAGGHSSNQILDIAEKLWDHFSANAAILLEQMSPAMGVALVDIMNTPAEILFGRRSVGRCRLGSNLKFSARVLRYLK